MDNPRASSLVRIVVRVIWFDLAHEPTYSMLGHEYAMVEKFLVAVPIDLIGAMAFPDFSVFTNGSTLLSAIKWVVMFALIGSLESLDSQNPFIRLGSDAGFYRIQACISQRVLECLSRWKRAVDHPYQV